MAALYLVEQGATLRKESRRLVVEKEDKILLEVPEFKIDRVLLFGNIQITTQAIAFLLSNGIETGFFTLNGRLKGKLTPLESKNVFLRVFQYKRYLDEDFKLDLARRIVAGKVRNALVLLQRYQRNHPEEVDFAAETVKLDECLHALPAKTRVSTVLGVEGFAAAIYFEAFARMLRKKLRFDSRNRRPPRDPVNALLSFGYALVTNEILSLLSGLGFDPYIGYLHGIEYGRPSLALDLIEEFRQPVVDRLTLSLLNREILAAEDFETTDDGWRLRDNGRKTYFLHYEKHLQASFTFDGTETSFRRLFQLQAQKLAAAIQKKEIYKPFLVK